MRSSDNWGVGGEGEWKILEMQRLCHHDVMSLMYCLIPESKMRIKNWVLLAYCFTERHRTHASTVNEVSLPKEGYVDRTLIYQPGQSFGGLDTSECCVEMISRRTNQKSVGKDLFLKVTSPCLDSAVAKLYTILTTFFGFG